MGEKLTLGKDRPLPNPLPDLEDYAVDFDGIDDHSHPYNWGFTTKYVRIHIERLCNSWKTTANLISSQIGF